MKRSVGLWLAIGMLSYCLLPWYLTEAGFWSFGWVIPANANDMSAFSTLLRYEKLWLAPIGAALLTILCVLVIWPEGPKKALVVCFVSIGSLLYLALQSWLIVRGGFRFADTEAPQLLTQIGLGAGGGVVALSFLMTATVAFAYTGKGRGDAFIVSLIGLIVALVAVFVFYPVTHILVRAFETADGGYSIAQFVPSYLSSNIWSVSCLWGGTCGPAVNSVILGICTGIGTTALGLAFALIFTRTNFVTKRTLRALTVLPIITPPFVIGLALILLFGRGGTVTELFANLFGLQPGRWIYGFWGVYLAQMLSFTPIAFLVLIGVVEGVSPSMEEASQTLNANRWQTFRNVSLPLMRPGLANAFLLGFIESIADFGNPLVLGGNFGVLSTEIYFAIVGAVADPAKAAVLAMVLLTLTLSAFFVQRAWLGKKSYATVTGKADSGQHAGLNPVVKAVCYCTALPWAAFTVVIYGMIIFGSFVKLWGIDHSFTLTHYLRAFSVSWANGVSWTGVAWDSFFTTLTISTVAAPLTALVGLSTAYLLVRQKFVGKDLFEFSTMLSFAIPGTVIGVSYIMAFNFPPIELTGTSAILIIVFVFRNMPVGVRGGIAAMSQLDKSLDEASITLGANSFTTVRRVIAPLLGPAILAALTYSFVRAITSVSAVIFLVSAEHNMATSFIVGRVENGEFGLAIAYSVVLIATMLAAILLLQVAIGRRKLRREDRVDAA